MSLGTFSMKPCICLALCISFRCTVTFKKLIDITAEQQSSQGLDRELDWRAVVSITTLCMMWKPRMQSEAR